MLVCSLADSVGEVGWIAPLILMLILVPRSQPRPSPNSWYADFYISNSFGISIEGLDLFDFARQMFN